METDKTQGTRNSALMIVAVIFEILIIIAIIGFATYLLLEIKVLQLTQKPTISTSSRTDSAADCPVGKQDTSAQGYYIVDGKENITIDGKSQSLCCGTINNKGTETKVCSDKSNSYTVMYTKIDGKFTLVSEMYPKDEKRCMKIYQATAQGSEICV